MRFGGHQTFHLKTSWLHKGLAAVNRDPKIFFKDVAVEKLGMGKNMVESLRYWLEATGMAERGENKLHMTLIAQEVFNRDRFFELDGTLQLLHYLLASNEKTATVWHWFFNKFSASEFDVDSLNIYLESYISTNVKKKINSATLSKDINCLLKMYKSEDYSQKYDPETNNPSPFSKFCWIEQKNNRYIKRTLRAGEVAPLIFVFILYLFWEKDLQKAESINIEDIAGKENSPGLVFNLSLDQCVDIIEGIDRAYPKKYLEYNKSGGYFIVSLNRANVKKALRVYYDENQMVGE